jgi:glycine betaine/choline ABC-type transport system substrate-binding protein
MRISHPRVLAVAALLALAASGCGGDGDGDGRAKNEPIRRDPANASKRIVVGSKNFAEQYILGEIYAQSLSAAGFQVRKELDLGSEKALFKALRKGRIDAYPEYTGTALSTFYDVDTPDIPRDKDEAFADLRERLRADRVTPMPQTPFQNTFVVTSTKKTADDLGNPSSLSDVAAKAGASKRLSAFPECRVRTDCFVGLQRAYGWSPKFISSEGKFEDLDQGQADFTMGFGTDGELTLDKYATYEDDKRLFPPYFITVLVRDEAVDRLGASGRAVIEQVQRPLTESVMQELNSKVTLEKQDPERVAREYLRDQGFVGGAG